MHGLDGVFHAQDLHEKNKDHKPGSSIGAKNKAILQKRAKDDGNSESLSSAAAAVIEQKQLDQQIQDLKSEINSKFPSKPGEKSTWDQILEERERRLAEKKEREKQAKIDAEERAERRRYMLIQLAQGAVVLVVVCGYGHGDSSWWL